MLRRFTVTLTVGGTAAGAVLLLLVSQDARVQLLAGVAAGVIAAALAWAA
jgi:hypothetical protein